MPTTAEPKRDERTVHQAKAKATDRGGRERHGLVGAESEFEVSQVFRASKAFTVVAVGPRRDLLARTWRSEVEDPMQIMGTGQCIRRPVDREI